MTEFDDYGYNLALYVKASLYRRKRKAAAESKDQTMTHESTIARVRAIHAVLDEAVPIVAAHPEVVAVWAEFLPNKQIWAARYEIEDGHSTYLGRSDMQTVSEQLKIVRRYHATSVTYPGAIRFEAREVAEWPNMKAEMVKDWQTFGSKVSSCSAVTFFGGGPHLANDNDLVSHSGVREAVARGLCLFREQLLDGTDPRHAGAVDRADAKLATKPDVELVWLLPPKECELSAGMKIKSADGNELTMLQDGIWGGDGFVDLVRVSFDEGVTISVWRYPAAIGFPKPKLWPCGACRCDSCGKDIEPVKASMRCIGGVVAYTSCGGHESDAEFLAGALGLTRGETQPTETHTHSILQTLQAVDDDCYPPSKASPEAIAKAIGTGISAAFAGIERVASRAQARAYESLLTSSRYTASNLALEAEISAKQAAKDAARARRVAVLGETLRQKVEPRYPNEGRSERALPNANGVKRWT